MKSNAIIQPKQKQKESQPEEKEETSDRKWLDGNRKGHFGHGAWVWKIKALCFFLFVTICCEMCVRAGMEVCIPAGRGRCLHEEGHLGGLWEFGYSRRWQWRQPSPEANRDTGWCHRGVMATAWEGGRGGHTTVTPPWRRDKGRGRFLNWGYMETLGAVSR